VENPPKSSENQQKRENPPKSSKNQQKVEKSANAPKLGRY
jgi:hypothetical protein